MTPERWTDAMLDRLASSIGQIAELTYQNTASIATLSSTVGQHQTILERFQQNFEEIMLELRTQSADVREMQADVREMQADVREMQAEVRGLQTENRRILDQLLNPNPNDEGA